MNYAEYKTAKSFNEIIKDSGKHLYEVYMTSENGYTPKRYLCTISVRNDNWRKVIIITPYDKFGRQIYSWSAPFCVGFVKDEYAHMASCLESNIMEKQGYNTFALSRDGVYKHCMDKIKSRMQELRKKEVELHNAIFSV